jgi:hypothetical protein
VVWAFSVGLLTPLAQAQDLSLLIPLSLYWDATRGDHFTTATAEGKQDAEVAGYIDVRRPEGQVFARFQRI